MLTRPVGGGTGGVFAQAWKLMPSPPYSAPYGAGPGAKTDGQAAFGTLDALLLGYIDGSLGTLAIGNTGGVTVVGSAAPTSLNTSDGFGSFDFTSNANWKLSGTYNSSGAFSSNDSETLSYSFHETGYTPDGSTFTLTDIGEATLTITGSGTSLSHTLTNILTGNDSYSFQQYQNLSTTGANQLTQSQTFTRSGDDNFSLTETQTEAMSSNGSITSGTDAYSWTYYGSDLPSVTVQAVDNLSDTLDAIYASETQTASDLGTESYSLIATGSDVIGSNGDLTSGNKSFSWTSSGNDSGSLNAGGTDSGQGQSVSAGESGSNSDTYTGKQSGNESYTAVDGSLYSWSEGVVYGYSLYQFGSNQSSLTDSNSVVTNGINNYSADSAQSNASFTQNDAGSTTEHLTLSGAQDLTSDTITAANSSYSWSQDGADINVITGGGYQTQFTSYNNNQTSTGMLQSDIGTLNVSQSSTSSETMNDTPVVGEMGTSTLGLYGLPTGGTETLAVADTVTAAVGGSNNGTDNFTDSYSDSVNVAGGVAADLITSSGYDSFNGAGTSTDTSTSKASSVLLLGAGGVLYNVSTNQSASVGVSSKSTSGGSGYSSAIDHSSSPDISVSDSSSSNYSNSGTITDNSTDAPSQSESLALQLSSIGAVVGGVDVTGASDTYSDLSTVNNASTITLSDQSSTSTSDAQSQGVDNSQYNDTQTLTANATDTPTVTSGFASTTSFGTAGVVLSGSSSSSVTLGDQNSSGNTIIDQSSNSDTYSATSTIGLDSITQTVTNYSYNNLTNSASDIGAETSTSTSSNSLGAAGVLLSAVSNGTDVNTDSNSISLTDSGSGSGSASGTESINLGDGTGSGRFSSNGNGSSTDQASASDSSTLQDTASESWGASGIPLAGSNTENLSDNATDSSSAVNYATTTITGSNQSSGTIGQIPSNSSGSQSYSYSSGPSLGGSWSQNNGSTQTDFLTNTESSNDTINSNNYLSMSLGVAAIATGGTATNAGTDNASDSSSNQATVFLNSSGTFATTDVEAGTSISQSESVSQSVSDQSGSQSTDTGLSSANDNTTFGAAAMILSGIDTLSGNDTFSNSSSDQSTTKWTDVNQEAGSVSEGGVSDQNSQSLSMSDTLTQKDSQSNGGSDNAQNTVTLSTAGMLASAILSQTLSDSGSFNGSAGQNGSGSSTLSDSSVDTAGVDSISDLTTSAGSQNYSGTATISGSDSMTSTLAENLGSGGTITSANPSESFSTTDSGSDTNTLTDTSTETDSQNSNGDDFQTTQTLTNTLSQTDTFGDGSQGNVVTNLGVNGLITGGNDNLTNTSTTSSNYNNSGSGAETSSDTGLSLSASLSNSGSGSSSNSVTDTESDTFGSSGVYSTGTDVVVASSNASDTETQSATGSETFADLGCGPSVTGGYTDTQSGQDSFTSSGTTTLTMGASGSINSGMEYDSWGESIGTFTSMNVDGSSISIDQTNSNTYNYNQSGTLTLGADAAIMSGFDSFTWTQWGTDSYSYNQLGQSLGQTVIYGTTYSETHDYSLNLDLYDSASWSDAGGDSLGTFASITDGYDDYTWAKIRDLTMDVSDSGSAAGQSSGSDSVSQGETSHELNGSSTDNYTFTDEGSDELGTGDRHGRGRYMYMGLDLIQLSPNVDTQNSPNVDTQNLTVYRIPDSRGRRRTSRK